MISIKQWCLAIFVLTMLVIGSTAAWLVYYGNFTPKMPLRAKQVISYQLMR
ncbi:MAG: hypothetical protein H6Q67_28 [Firmicutes bacterium]|nr:hypothetical protein [Bacillota bacterium]